MIRPDVLEDVKLQDLDALVQLHLASPLLLVQAALPAMKAAGFGRIVLLSSRAVLGLAARTAYSATKAGLIGMARTWALELAPHGITVNVVAPGPIAETAMLARGGAGRQRERGEAGRQHSRSRRLGRPEDVARAVMFFAAAESGFITGQTLFVCGGASVGSLALVSMAGGDRTLQAAIFDVDGVLLASPHERAWRAALAGFADPARFTTAFYQAQVAGKPRPDGALAALRGLGVPDAAARAEAYADRKQACAGGADRGGRVHRLRRCGAAGAGAACARPAAGGGLVVEECRRRCCARSRLDGRRDAWPICSMPICPAATVPHGKPAPDIFLLAAAALRAAPARCVVVEDAPAGIAAARAGGMAALGIARLGDSALLQAAGAELVVTDLDQVDIDALAAGTLRRRDI